jgi:hypothetical protein
MKAVLLLLCALGVNAMAAEMTEIRYLDQEPEQPAYTSRILVLGDRLRMDYGRDEDDFILYDFRAGMVWLVAHGERRVTGIPAQPMKQVVKTAAWPQGWKLSQERQASAGDTLFQVRLNDQLCVEYKTAPILKAEARLLRDFRRALAGNQATSWNNTPEALRQPCSLVLDVRQAGLEYQLGLPLAIRYWDGRSRVYQSHATRTEQPALFELPATYQRFVLGAPGRKPSSHGAAVSDR